MDVSKDCHTPSTNVTGEVFLLCLTGHFSIGYTWNQRILRMRRWHPMASTNFRQSSKMPNGRARILSRCSWAGSVVAETRLLCNIVYFFTSAKGLCDTRRLLPPPRKAALCDCRRLFISRLVCQQDYTKAEIFRKG